MPERVAVKERFTVLDHAPLGQFVVGRDFTVLFWNRCMEEWTGLARERIVGTGLLDHFPHLDAPKYTGRIRNIFRGGPPTVFSPQLHKHVIPAPLPGGKFRVQYTVVTSVPADEEGTFYAMFAIQDVTSLTEAIENHQVALQKAMKEMEEREKAEAELARQAEELKRLNGELEERAIRDGLTELYNHRHFHHLLRRDFLLALRHGADLSCLLLDLDHFKRVNDTYGHPCGDYVLRELAGDLRNKVRDTDIVARYGGEEFAVLLPNTDIAGAVTLAYEIREMVEKRKYSFGSRTVRITCSIGIATLREHRPEDHHVLLDFADRALYQAKAEGRNRIRGYTVRLRASC